MKKLITLLFLVCSFLPQVQAVEGCDQRLSPEEFRAKQQAYITEKAGLTTEEAEKFFPIYFELQERKHRLNKEAWELLRKGKDENVTEAQYEEMLDAYYDTRVAVDRLDKSYFEKFKKILSARKIYLIHRAEISFNRDLVKGMHPKGKGGGKGDSPRGGN